MTRRTRIYVNLPLAPETEIVLPDDAARHVRKALRLQPGAELTLFNGDGRDYEAQLTASNIALVRAVGPEEPAPPFALRLAVGISKGERMDWIVQKSVELGVAAVYPLITDRTQIRLSDERQASRLRRWTNIAVSACEQSGRRRLPDIHPAMNLAEWLADICCGQGFMASPRAEQGIASVPRPANGALDLLFGPEGGLSAAEEAAALDAGLRAVRLGPRILRAETAPLAALSAIQALWGDWAANNNPD